MEVPAAPSSSSTATVHTDNSRFIRSSEVEKNNNNDDDNNNNNKKKKNGSVTISDDDDDDDDEEENDDTATTNTVPNDNDDNIRTTTTSTIRMMINDDGDDNNNKKTAPAATTTTSAPGDGVKIMDGSREDTSKYVDITSILRACCRTSLSVRVPFLCSDDDAFNLHDAMGATQLNDTKMDCCVIPISAYYCNNSSSNNRMNPSQQEVAAPPPATTATTATTTTTTTTHDHDDNTKNDNAKNDNVTPATVLRKEVEVEDVAQENRTVFPRPIPDGLYDVMSPLPWDDVTVHDATTISLNIVIRLQSLLSGASIGESTFTCLYAHAAVLRDMKHQLSNNHQIPCFPPEESTSTENDDDERNDNNNNTNNSIHKAINDLHIIDQKDNGNTIDNPSSTTTNMDGTKTTTRTKTTEEPESCHRGTDESSSSSSSSIETRAAQIAIFASALALVDTTEVVRGVILNADIYEEEDFAANTHFIQFFTDQVDISTSKVLEYAIKYIDDNYFDILQVATSANNNNNNTIQMLRLILDYQLDFYITCTTLARLSQTNLRTTVQNVQNTIRHAVQKIKQLQTCLVNNITQQQQHDDENVSSDSKRSLMLLQRTFDSYVNRPFVGNLPVRKIMFQDPIVSIGMLQSITTELDTVLCTILLHGTSLRRIHRMLDRLMNHNDYKHNNINVGTTTTTNNTWLGTNILTRSLLLLNLYFDEKLLGQYSLRQLILEDIIVTTSPRKDQPQLQLPNQQESSTSEATLLTSSEHGRAYLNRLMKPIYDVLKLRLLNTNRHRTYIEAISLPDWVVLQNEAQVVDSHILKQTKQHKQEHSTATNTATYYFSQYAISILVRIMDRYIESGVEVGLFRSTSHCHYCDYSFALWYRAFLLSALSHDLTKVRQMQQQQENNRINLNTSNNNSAVNHHTATKGKKKHNSHSKHHYKAASGPASPNNVHPVRQLEPGSPTVEDIEDLFEYKFIVIKRNLCRKLVEYMAALQKAQILKDEHTPGYYQFTTTERIFQKRFEVFQQIKQPPALSYEHYMEGVDFTNVTQEEVLNSASLGFQSIRMELEQLAQDITRTSDSNSKAPLSPSSKIITSIDPVYATVSEDEIKSLVKVCIGNSVYIQKLKQLIVAQGTTTAKVMFDFETHTQFCTIKLL